MKTSTGTRTHHHRRPIVVSPSRMITYLGIALLLGVLIGLFMSSYLDA